MPTPRNAASLRLVLSIWAAVLVVAGVLAASTISISTAPDADIVTAAATTQIAASIDTTTTAAPAPSTTSSTAAPTTTTAPAPAPASTAAPIPTSTTAPSTTVAPVATVASDGIAQTWAVVVGADNYHGHEIDLDAGISDATATSAALESGLGVQAAHRRVLLGDDLSNGNLRAALAWLVANAGPEDDAVFFYAGHVNHHGGNRQALLLPDGSEIFDVELRDALAGLQAARTWLPIAGCFSAGFDELLAPGRMLTAASGRDELSYENSAIGHSYLVKYVIVDELGTGAAASIEDAFARGVERLRQDYPNRLPLQFDQVAGDWALAA